ncbi:hypothetical protein HZF08_24080 [Paenibacillus sp. CGMCC 1.16610]|uniref:Small, acid-soluble spore protein gamma-type n=1 Tax=Paenibacillus anseongense TaxID=2682845 RepID=A0ABW9UNA0_9BACL|nr:MULTISPECIES: hypothetical protein [Paenibacillus]MBA2941364.1 hypothetical protein [Paenibacillus sp. CGMCC 1.16610]MVQ40183.1 hypothetical protein [Paenibacillus anseongense]
MPDTSKSQKNVVENKTSMFNNMGQSATNYVQNAIENVFDSTQDATQNLVNNVMKRRKSGNKSEV